VTDTKGSDSIQSQLLSESSSNSFFFLVLEQLLTLYKRFTYEEKICLEILSVRENYDLLLPLFERYLHVSNVVEVISSILWNLSFYEDFLEEELVVSPEEEVEIEIKEVANDLSFCDVLIKALQYYSSQAPTSDATVIKEIMGLITNLSSYDSNKIKFTFHESFISLLISLSCPSTTSTAQSSLFAISKKGKEDISTTIHSYQHNYEVMKMFLIIVANLSVNNYNKRLFSNYVQVFHNIKEILNYFYEKKHYEMLKFVAIVIKNLCNNNFLSQTQFSMLEMNKALLKILKTHYQQHQEPQQKEDEQLQHDQSQQNLPQPIFPLEIITEILQAVHILTTIFEDDMEEVELHEGDSFSPDKKKIQEQKKKQLEKRKHQQLELSSGFHLVKEKEKLNNNLLVHHQKYLRYHYIFYPHHDLPVYLYLLHLLHEQGHPSQNILGGEGDVEGFNRSRSQSLSSTNFFSSIYPFHTSNNSPGSHKSTENHLQHERMDSVPVGPLFITGSDLQEEEKKQNILNDLVQANQNISQFREPFPLCVILVDSLQYYFDLYEQTSLAGEDRKKEQMPQTEEKTAINTMIIKQITGIKPTFQFVNERILITLLKIMENITLDPLVQQAIGSGALISLLIKVYTFIFHHNQVEITVQAVILQQICKIFRNLLFHNDNKPYLLQETESLVTLLVHSLGKFIANEENILYYLLLLLHQLSYHMQGEKSFLLFVMNSEVSDMLCIMLSDYRDNEVIVHEVLQIFIYLLTASYSSAYLDDVDREKIIYYSLELGRIGFCELLCQCLTNFQPPNQLIKPSSTVSTILAAETAAINPLTIGSTNPTPINQKVTMRTPRNATSTILKRKFADNILQSLCYTIFLMTKDDQPHHKHHSSNRIAEVSYKNDINNLKFHELNCTENIAWLLSYYMNDLDLLPYLCLAIQSLSLGKQNYFQLQTMNVLDVFVQLFLNYFSNIDLCLIICDSLIALLSLPGSSSSHHHGTINFSALTTILRPNDLAVLKFSSLGGCQTLMTVYNTYLASHNEDIIIHILMIMQLVATYHYQHIKTFSSAGGCELSMQTLNRFMKNPKVLVLNCSIIHLLLYDYDNYIRFYEMNLVEVLIDLYKVYGDTHGHHRHAKGSIAEMILFQVSGIIFQLTSSIVPVPLSYPKKEHHFRPPLLTVLAQFARNHQTETAISSKTENENEHEEQRRHYHSQQHHQHLHFNDEIPLEDESEDQIHAVEKEEVDEVNQLMNANRQNNYLYEYCQRFGELGFCDVLHGALMQNHSSSTHDKDILRLQVGIVNNLGITEENKKRFEQLGTLQYVQGLSSDGLLSPAASSSSTSKCVVC
jgi:hypothetical protein